MLRWTGAGMDTKRSTATQPHMQQAGMIRVLHVAMVISVTVLADRCDLYLLLYLQIPYIF